MSFKSFDKFCEDLILKQPGSEKIILDERQKIMRSKILTEAFILFSILALLNCLVMDMAYQWAETFSAPLLVFMLICACYFNIRCAATGCLVGINGEKSAKISAAYCIFMGVMMMIRYFFSDDGDRVLFSDGKVTDNFCCMMVWILAVLCGIMTFLLMRINHGKEY